MNMITLTIDGVEVSVPAGSTVLEAARAAGIRIPTLCYMKDINEIGACRICVVEIEGMERLAAACNNAVEEGMVIYTNSPRVMAARKSTLELILSEHEYSCATCATQILACATFMLLMEICFSYERAMGRMDWRIIFVSGEVSLTISTSLVYTDLKCASFMKETPFMPRVMTRMSGFFAATAS